MKIYQLKTETGTVILDNASITEVYEKLPPGSKQVGVPEEAYEEFGRKKYRKIPGIIFEHCKVKYIVLEK